MTEHTNEPLWFTTNCFLFNERQVSPKVTSSLPRFSYRRSSRGIKTVVLLRQRCYWYGMVRDVQIYIATCAECARNKRVRVNPRAPLQCFQAGIAGNPGERLHLDILGPFLESSRGNQYALMMVDQFPRWLEHQALSIQDAETVAHAFFESYTVQFGVPFVIHTYQAETLTGLCEDLDHAISTNFEWAGREIQPASAEFPALFLAR